MATENNLIGETNRSEYLNFDIFGLVAFFLIALGIIFEFYEYFKFHDYHNLLLIVFAFIVMIILVFSNKPRQTKK